jgi:glycine cleavage system H protein
MNFPDDCLYTKTHEWARDEGDGTVVCGITDHAQESLGDIVYVELPIDGDEVEAGAAFGVVDSVKASSDIYAAVSGTVVAVNEELENAPELVNESPYGEGWLVKIELDDAAQLDDLMDAAAYEAFLEESG